MSFEREPQKERRLYLVANIFPHASKSGVGSNKWVEEVCKDRRLEQQLRSLGLKPKDAKAACVAIRRARKVKYVKLVSSDPDFHNNYRVRNELRRNNVKLVDFDEFLEELSDP